MEYLKCTLAQYFFRSKKNLFCSIEEKQGESCAKWRGCLGAGEVERIVQEDVCDQPGLHS